MNTAKIFSIDAGVTAAKVAVANGAGPVVLADHSDRSGYATWLLRAVIEQGLPRVLIGTLADAKLVASLIANGAKVGDAVNAEVGGLVDESAGLPVRIQGQIVGTSQAPERMKGHTWFHIGFETTTS